MDILPTEIIINILKYLSYTDIKNLWQSNGRLNSIISTNWSYLCRTKFQIYDQLKLLNYQNLYYILDSIQTSHWMFSPYLKYYNNTIERNDTEDILLNQWASVETDIVINESKIYFCQIKVDKLALSSNNYIKMGFGLCDRLEYLIYNCPFGYKADSFYREDSQSGAIYLADGRLFHNLNGDQQYEEWNDNDIISLLVSYNHEYARFYRNNQLIVEFSLYPDINYVISSSLVLGSVMTLSDKNDMYQSLLFIANNMDSTEIHKYFNIVIPLNSDF